MRAFITSPARKGNKRAAAVSLLAWLALMLILTTALGAVAARSTAAAGGAADATHAFFPPRVERDRQRHLIWSIGQQAVLLYDGRMRSLIKKVALPDWSYVDEPQSCAPDIAIDADGNALVSSNVQPDLWRINPRSHVVEHLAIELDADNNQEVGFTGLLFVDANTLLAASSIQGSLWRIDLVSRKAHKLSLAHPIRGICALGLKTAVVGTQPLSLLLCAPTRHGVHQIEVTGLTQATLRAEPCIHPTQASRPQPSRLQTSLENPK